PVTAPLTPRLTVSADDTPRACSSVRNLPASPLCSSSPAPYASESPTVTTRSGCGSWWRAEVWRVTAVVGVSWRTQLCVATSNRQIATIRVVVTCAGSAKCLPRFWERGRPRPLVRRRPAAAGGGGRERDAPAPAGGTPALLRKLIAPTLRLRPRSPVVAAGRDAERSRGRGR